MNRGAPLGWLVGSAIAMTISLNFALPILAAFTAGFGLSGLGIFVGDAIYRKAGAR